MDLLNTLIDASIRGTLFGITLFFWGFALVMHLEMVLWCSSRGRFIGCFQNLMKKKDKNNE